MRALFRSRGWMRRDETVSLSQQIHLAGEDRGEEHLVGVLAASPS
jgi:hypothetical protein